MENKIKQISVKIANGKADRGALFVDVREKDELEDMSYNVPTIVNIPLSQFEKKFSELPKNKELIIVCRSGNRSLYVTNFLADQGYSNVANMEGGILDWIDAGFPVSGKI